MVNLELSDEELRLVKKLCEANDSGMIDRRGRLGGIRVRTSLQHKVFEAVDALGGNDDDEADTTGEQ